MAAGVALPGLVPVPVPARGGRMSANEDNAVKSKGCWGEMLPVVVLVPLASASRSRICAVKGEYCALPGMERGVLRLLRLRRLLVGVRGSNAVRAVSTWLVEAKRSNFQGLEVRFAWRLGVECFAERTDRALAGLRLVGVLGSLPSSSNSLSISSSAVLLPGGIFSTSLASGSLATWFFSWQGRLFWVRLLPEISCRALVLARFLGVGKRIRRVDPSSSTSIGLTRVPSTRAGLDWNAGCRALEEWVLLSLPSAPPVG